MLCEITIRNLAVFAGARLSTGPGLTVLTGETGAGKSLVVDAVELGLGGRADPVMVRSGAERASVDLVFHIEPDRSDLAAAAVAEDGLLVVTREVLREGRSTARVNDRPVTVAELRRVVAGLVDIHGQHEQQELLRPDGPRRALDAYAGIEGLTAATGAAVAAWRAASSQRGELLAAAAERKRRRQWLEHQHQEIAAAALSAGEDEVVAAAYRRAEHAHRILEALGEARQVLAGDELSAADFLGRAGAALRTAGRYDPDCLTAAGQVAELVDACNEVARDLATRAADIEVDPARLAALGDRLAHIEDLKRKYGPGLDEVLAAGRQAAEELAELERADEAEAAGARQVAEAEAAAATLADEAAAARQAAAAELSAAVTDRLSALGLAGARVVWRVGRQPDDRGVRAADGHHYRLYEHGFDEVTVQFAPGPGEALRPLGRVASGGELSRIMLATKVQLAAADRVGTLIFDEVDVGVGGETANEMARLLQALGATHQVLCVTHLPQVAAAADCQVAVRSAAGDRHQAELSALGDEERVAEIARMLGERQLAGSAAAYARRLLERTRRA